MFPLKSEIKQKYQTLALSSHIDGSADKESTCNIGNMGDLGLILRSGRPPGGGHGNLLQYSCLENPLDRETWRATVHRVFKSQTRLKQLSRRTHSLVQPALALCCCRLSPGGGQGLEQVFGFPSNLITEQEISLFSSFPV